MARRYPIALEKFFNRFTCGFNPIVPLMAEVTLSMRY